MTVLSKEPVHCLLVDDLEENLVALEALLHRPDLVLLKAHSGPEALEFLLQYEVALAILDVKMPQMDGFELAELMRGTERTRRVPIIFLTASCADGPRRFRGYEAGAVDFLLKPIEPDILRSKADVFVELFRQRQEVARQRDELRTVAMENARLLAESRRNAAALAEADRRKDEFLATLAHELRNPLAPIRNALQILTVRGEANPEIQAYRKMIERQVNHLVRLVDDLLDVSRISRGKIELRRDRVRLAEVIQNAVETSGPLIAANKHELTVSVPAGPLEVLGDGIRLTQVLANLLNNAAKYTPAGGHIFLAVEAEGKEAVVRVRDDGVGIPGVMLGKVFDMFTQIQPDGQRSQGGLGIGLTLAKRLVEMHGGTIVACSKGEGQGAEFIVRLPRADCPDEPAAGEADQGTAKAAVRRRVLVVDDNKDAAESLAMLLSMNGHEVCTAYGGAAGLEQAVSFKPNVIVLDLGMPGMDGYEVARRVRQLPGGRAIVLVALTGWGQEEDRHRTQEAGFDFHLVKPVDPATLEELLATLRVD
jgi:signal transduction histidine kinase